MICLHCGNTFRPKNSSRYQPIRQFCSRSCSQLFQWRNNPKGDKTLQERARTKMKNEIRSGRLIRQPCEVCGKPADGHHEDYTKPLIVRWLCRSHHFILHRKPAIKTT